MPKVSRLALAILLFRAAAASAATIIVTDVTDTLHGAGCAATGTGLCSLRDAITFANANPGLDVINFGLATGLQTISLGSALPVITEGVTIDGTTQPGSSVNTNPLLQGLNTVIGIEIDGTNGGPSCLQVSSSNTTIKGLAINRCGTNDIYFLPGAFAGNRVEGNFIGTNAAGTGFYSGKDAWGILIYQGSTFTIGGTAPASRNLIGGSFRGIEIGDNGNTGHIIQGNILGLTAAGDAPLNPASGTFGISLRVINGVYIANNVISGLGGGIAIGNALGDTGVVASSIFGNFIGTDVSGTIPIGNNGYGVAAYSVNNTIGGAGVGLGNVIAGTKNGPGITIQGGTNTTIQGNHIGTDSTDTLDLGNKYTGIDVEASNCTIGGTSTGDGNTIAFNGGIGLGSSGVGVVSGVQHTAIERNRIFHNKRTNATNGLGIDLGDDGVTLNDPCDADVGPNGFQNFPVITAAVSGAATTNIQGTLNSTAGTAFRIEFFSNQFCDPTGYGEGQNYIGFTNVTTDGSCNATFNATFPVSVPSNYVLTATATDPNGNTSEFSACAPLPALFHTIPPCRVVDTRNPNGPYGGPALGANTDRSFVFTGQCGIPATATGVAVNIAVTAPSGQGDLRLYPTGAVLPLTSAINFNLNNTRANNGVFVLGPNGDLTVHDDQATGGTVHVIIDVDGYFQ